MAITFGFSWQNPDATQTLNDRLRGLVQRGIYYGGGVTPGVGLSVTVAPFLGIGFDGMTLGDTAPPALLVLANQTQYLVVRCRYNALGTPAAITGTWEVLEASVYAADPEKDYLLVFAVVTLGPVVVVTSADINMAVRDEVTPVGRAWFRGVAANAAALPLPPPTRNLVGDHYYVIADNTFYFWTGAAWTPMTSAGYNAETILHNRDLVDNEIQRLTNGSGVISGTRYGLPGFTGSKLEITAAGTPGVDNSLDIDTFAAVVYGHTVVTKGTTVPLLAHPGPADPDRYDLIFLEVWREAIAVPETHGYGRNPTGALTYTLPQATAVVETLSYQSGVPLGIGDNFDFNTVGATAHTGYVVKWRFGTFTADSTALYDPISGLAGWGPLNIDGNAFAAVGSDPRIWSALAMATSIDTRSWAIPLLVIRRRENETFGINPIAEYYGGTRYISPVYPVADVAKLSRDLAETAAVQGPLSVTLMDTGGPTLQPNDKPSGFITGMDYQVGPGVAGHTLKFYQDAAKFRIRGFEDWTRFNVSEFVLGASGGIGTWRRQFVYVEMSITLYQWDDTDTANLPGYYTSKVHRPLIPTSLLGGVVVDGGQGWRRGFVTYRVVTTDFGAVDYRDADDSMAAAGWTKGDVFLAGSPLASMDGGLWSKAVAIDVDDRIHPFLTQWAIPVALVHRRNSGAWNYATNPNGTGVTRPDDRKVVTTIHPDDLVDLRCTVDLDEATLAKQLTTDFDRNMKGQLRTRMANKWAGTGVGTGPTVAGTRVLQTDKICAVPDAVAFSLAAPPDGCRMIWSDAKEFMPVCAVIPDFSNDYNAGHVNPLVPVAYAAAARTLQAYAPDGAHLLRWLPSAFVAGGSGSANYLQFNGPPLWSTRELFDRNTVPIPSAAAAKVLKPDGVGPFYTEENLHDQATVGWLCFDVPTALAAPAMHDASGHIISMTETMLTPYPDADVVPLSWWVHYDRNMKDARYAANHGLAEIPDEVHQVIQDPLGANDELHVGTLYTVVRKTTVPGVTWVEVTQADVTAASGTPGVVTLLGIAHEHIRYTSTPAGNIASVILNNAQDTIRITMDAVWGVAQEIDIIVFYETTDVNQWVDIGRGGKSVMGPFCWHQENVDLSALAADGPVAVPLSVGTSWWRHADVAGMLVEMPIVWQRTAPGASWYLVRLHRANEWAAAPPQTPLSVGYPFSNVLSLSSAWPNASGKPLLKIVVPRSNPTNTDILVHYTYTPYQGLSNSGGAIVNPIPAGTVTTGGLTRTKALLHGTVLHNTDWVVTQDGPCSKWGGVDSWTGWPCREPDRYLNFGYSAFADFNSPRIVRPNAQQGLQDTFGRNTTSTNAAAVLRMPYPGDAYNILNYQYIHEYDLDPGREGASCGWFSYAPGYYGSLTCDMVTPGLITSLVLRDQWVNGVTPLGNRAVQPQQDSSTIIPPCGFTSRHLNVALYGDDVLLPVVVQHDYWEFLASEKLSIDASLLLRRNTLLCSTATHMRFWDVPAIGAGPPAPELTGGDLFSATTAAGVEGSALLMSSMPFTIGGSGTTAPVLAADRYLRGFERLSWPNAWKLGGGFTDDSVFLCHGCGTIHLFYLSMLLDAQPVLRLWVQASALGGAVTRKIDGTYVVAENNRAFTSGRNIATTSNETPGLRLTKPIDTLVMPFGASSSRVTDHLTSTANNSHQPNYYADSTSAVLAGMTVQYPDSWDPATITAADALLQASETFNSTYSYGRGVYLRATHLGSTTYARLNMPVLVPGSGTPMNDVFRYTTLPNVTAESPPSVPSAPAESPFARTHRQYDSYDHGGAIAYCGFGFHMNPANAQYTGRVVMQISGGPLGQVRWPALYEYAESAETPDETSTDGTALDAFWPTGRPILKKK